MRRVAGGFLAALLVAAGCGGGGGDEPAAPDPAGLAGAWDVSLVVGLVEADPEADPLYQDVVTFQERWVFEDCDAEGCVLRRPDGGVLLGDLDGVRVALGEGTGLDADAALRLVGEGDAALPAEEGHEGPEEAPVEGEVEHEEHAGPCDDSPTQRWRIRVELGLQGRVLSGSAFRTPEALRDDSPGFPCFGYDLTLGLSGTPAG